MLSKTAVLVALLSSTADAGTPKFLQDLGNAFSAGGGEVKTHCKDPVASIEAWVSANGAISGDNIKAFTDFSEGPRTQPGDALARCVELKLKPGSKHEASQREMALKLLDMTVAKHLVIDDVGDGRSYYAPAMGYYNDKPLGQDHQACNEMDPKATSDAYKGTFLLIKLNTALEKAGAHPEVSAAIQKKVDELVAKGREKSDACLVSKLGSIKPYVDAAPASIRTKWEETARVHTAQFTDLPILRVVFPEAQWRRTKRQDWDDYNKTWTPVDFKAMDVVVYLDNGEFVDGYIMAVVHDFIQEREYLTFPYAEGVGRLPDKPYQRVMKSNF